MAYENVEFTAPTMTGDRTNSNLYFFESGVLKAKQRGSPYNLVASYPANRYIDDVSCIQFDGVFYWTLEKQTNGFVLQKWFIQGGILKWQYSFGRSATSGMDYDADSFAIEYYGDSLSSGVSIGVLTLNVDDGDSFDVGDKIVIGPSTVAAYIGNYFEAIVVGKVGDTLQISTPTTSEFSSGDKVYTTRSLFVFNKYSPYDNNKGSILKLDPETGSLISFSSNHLFGEVKASCFYNNKITFIKGNEVVQIDPDTLLVYKHFAIDNLDVDRAHIVSAEAMWVYSDIIYILQNKYVFWDPIVGWDEELWGSYYNYVTEDFHTLLTSSVYFVELKAEPDIIHAISTGVPTASSNITVTVLDQARQPLDGRTVTMTSSVGSLTPSMGTTVSGGIFTCIYNGTSDETEVEITAEVV